jgi:hypothetical protein
LNLAQTSLRKESFELSGGVEVEADDEVDRAERALADYLQAGNTIEVLSPERFLASIEK